MDLKFEGGKELEQALADLGDPKLMRQSAMAALRQAANVVKQETQNQVPRRTGLLAKSVRVTSERADIPTMKVKFVGDAAIKRTGDKKVDSENMTKGGHGYVARFLEFGTKKKDGGVRMAARPFFRPAFDMSVQRALTRLKESLWEQIEKRAQAVRK